MCCHKQCGLDACSKCDISKDYCWVTTISVTEKMSVLVVVLSTVALNTLCLEGQTFLVNLKFINAGH
jgi:hypothetical protein